jgi:hypothetical protein
MPQDPLYNDRDSASRDLVRYGLIFDNFGTNFPLMGLLRTAGVTDVLFQGTGVENAFIYDYANGSATQPGSTITPQRKQMATDSKFDERFYQANLPVEETVYKLYNAPGDTQKFSQDDLDTYCLTKKIESMLEMDAYRHGQPAAGSAGGAATGVADDRFDCMNGFDEAFNNAVDPSPFGNVYNLYGYITRNGVVGQAYNSTPFYCGTPTGAAASITWPVLQGAIAQLSVVGAKAKAGFVGPFGWGAIAVMLRQSAVIQQLNVAEGTDFGWRSINFTGITIHEDPLAPSSVAFNYLPGGNPAAYGNTSPAKYLDGAGSNTRLAPFVSPTYTVNGAPLANGQLSPTGSNIPSNTLINPGEAMYFVDPESVVMTPPKPGSGWEWDTREVAIPNNISTNNRYLKVATNLWTPQASHGMIIYGFKGVRN